MKSTVDLVIRGGTVIDGTGGDTFVADVAIDDGLILAIGDVDCAGREEIDAKGCIVTPGFVDVHSHYDGQSIWSQKLDPSSSNGVTTVVLGNCGVGFAPCRADDRDVLISVMEGVEDIPGVVMAEGLSWDWETYPEYLDALASRPRDIDVASYLPHSALRVYAMGQRGASRDKAREPDLEKLRALVGEALDAGAIGVATSRFHMHRTGEGDCIPTFQAAKEELEAIVGVMAEKGRGVFQFAPDMGATDQVEDLRTILQIVETADCPTTFSLVQTEAEPKAWQAALGLLDDVGPSLAGKITAQVFPRPVGMMMGLRTTVHPFSLCPSYEPLNALPLAERVQAMRDPSLRRALMVESPQDPNNPFFKTLRNYANIFPFRRVEDYEPDPANSIAALAAASGRDPNDIAYDLLLEGDGDALLFNAIANFHGSSFATIEEMLGHARTIIGLGDGGAHYGLISDAAYPTFVLTHWTRLRSGKHLSLVEAVQALTKVPAAALGLHDRGVLAPGKKADVNIINYDDLQLEMPTVVHDLPNGAGRLVQGARGYVATIVGGEIIARNGQATGALPGKVVRSGGIHANFN